MLYASRIIDLETLLDYFPANMVLLTAFLILYSSDGDVALYEIAAKLVIRRPVLGKAERNIGL